MDVTDPRIQALIDRVEIFHGLDPSDVLKIYQKGMTMRFDKGETVFHKDTVGDQMYVVLGGKVGVFDGQTLLNELTVGAMFGEYSLLNNQKRSATVISLELSNLFVLDERVFNKLLEKRVAVQILMNIARVLVKRNLEGNKRIREMQGR